MMLIDFLLISLFGFSLLLACLAFIKAVIAAYAGAKLDDKF